MVCVGWFVGMFSVLKLWKLFLILGLVLIEKLSLLKKDLICVIVWLIGCKFFGFFVWLGNVIFIVFFVSFLLSFLVCKNLFFVEIVCWIICLVWLIFWFVVGCFLLDNFLSFLSKLVSLFFLFMNLILIWFNVVVFCVVLIWFCVWLIIVLSFMFFLIYMMIVWLKYRKNYFVC